MIERTTTKTATIGFKSDDLADFLCVLPSFLFETELSDLADEESWAAMSQKDLVVEVIKGGASYSGSKISEASVGASMDIRSTQLSFTTWQW